MAQARDTVGEAVTRAIDRCFAGWLAQSRPCGAALPAAPDRRPAMRFGAAVDADGAANPGHDPTRVPVVRSAQVQVRRDADDLEQVRVWFSYKVEQGHPPQVVLRVPRNWLSAVVAPGYVVLGGFPTLAVGDRDRQGRPTAVRVAVVGGFFDASMHGWRAHAHTHRASVTWSSDADAPGRAGDGARVEVGAFVA